MEFVVLAYDHTDPEALSRRLANREAHLQCISEHQSRGNMIFGAALLDDSEQMQGSIIVCEFPSRTELDNWLKIEPYITGKVWDKVEVLNCKAGPSFKK